MADKRYRGTVEVEDTEIEKQKTTSLTADKRYLVVNLQIEVI